MKHTALITVLAALTLTACDKNPANEPLVPPSQKMPLSMSPALPPPSSTTLPPGHPAAGSGDSAMTSAKAPDVEQMEQATVVSTIDVQDFTYIEIEQGNQARWLAARTTPVKKGAIIEFDSNSTIENFKSKALNRTFSSITFVNTVTIIKGK